MSKKLVVHGEPTEGMECKATYEPITKEDGNYVEYFTVPSNTWHPCLYGKETVEYLIGTQFKKYIEDVEKASKDCAAAVRRLVTKGPPTYLNDDVALKLPEGDSHVEKVWFQGEDKEVSAKLAGVPSKEELEALWNSQKETLAAMIAAEEGGVSSKN